jgi:dCMP deaminase
LRPLSGPLSFEEEKMDRITFEEIYMQLAYNLSKRSTCKRLKVGAVVVSTDYSRVYGIGYNGNAKDMPNTCDSDEPGNCGCLHAEDNALLKTNGGSEVEKIIFVTHAPCVYCAKRIINKGGVKKIYYAQKYRSDNGLNILQQSGIDCELLRAHELLNVISKNEISTIADLQKYFPGTYLTTLVKRVVEAHNLGYIQLLEISYSNRMAPPQISENDIDEINTRFILSMLGEYILKNGIEPRGN